MKTYVVSVEGVEAGYLKAGSHNAAEKKAAKKYPGKNVSVAYTEVSKSEETWSKEEVEEWNHQYSVYTR